MPVIGEVNVGWQEARVRRVWVHHIFISSLGGSDGPAAVHYGNGRPKKGTSQESFLTDARDQQRPMLR